MQIFEEIAQYEHEQVVLCYEPAAGYKGIIAIHNTTLGPALGGTRFWQYVSTEEAVTDAPERGPVEPCQLLFADVEDEAANLVRGVIAEGDLVAGSSGRGAVTCDRATCSRAYARTVRPRPDPTSRRWIRCVSLDEPCRTGGPCAA